MAEGSDTPEKEANPNEKAGSRITRRQLLKGLAGAAALGGLAAAGISRHQESVAGTEKNIPSYLQSAFVLVREVHGGRVKLEYNTAQYDAPDNEDQGFINVSKNNPKQSEELRLSPEELMDKWTDGSIPMSTLALHAREKIDENRAYLWDLYVYNDKSYILRKQSPYLPIPGSPTPGQRPNSHLIYETYFNPVSEQPVGYTVGKMLYVADKLGKTTLQHSTIKGDEKYPKEIDPQQPIIPQEIKRRMEVLVQGLSQQVKR